MPIPPGTDPPIPPSRKRVRRRLAILGAGVCLLGVLLLLVLQSDPVRQIARRRLTAFLASRQIDLQMDSLGYNLFTLSIDLQHLRIRSAAAELPAFATVGRARLDLSLTQLLRGRYVVQSGALDDVDVQYVVEADGRDNLPRPPADPNSPRSAFRFLVTSSSISNARVRYTNRAQQMDLAVSLLPIQVTGNATTERHQVRVESSSGTIQIGSRTEAVDRVSGLLDLGRDDLKIDRFLMEAAGSRVELAGDVRSFDQPSLGLKLRATVDGARTAALLDVREPVAGTIAVDGAVAGRLSAPTIDLHLSGSNVKVRSLAAAEADVRAT